MRLFKRDFPIAPSKEDFDYSTITPERLPSIMRRHIATGALGTIYGVLTANMFQFAFGNAIGVTIEQWGVLTAICAFAISLQLVGAYLGARVGHRRLIWYVLEFSSRLVRGAGFVIPFLLYRHGDKFAAAVTMIVLLGAGSLSAAAASPVWFSWLADIIPQKIQGSFMGRRDMWISFAAIAVIVPLSYLLDRAPKELKPHALVAVFCFAIVLGVIDMGLHRVIPEPPLKRKNLAPFKEQILAPITNPDYGYWLLFNVVWNFAFFLGTSLSNVYFLDNLGIRNNFLGGAISLIVAPYVGMLFTSRWSGVLIDRIGVKKVLIGAFFCQVTLPVFWIVATPPTALFWLSVNSVLGGIGLSTGVNAYNKYILRLPPRSQRAMYLAVTNCLNNISGGIASLIAGFLLAGFAGRHWMFWGRDWVPFQLLFAISVALRLLAWFMLFFLQRPRFDQTAFRNVEDSDSSRGF
jgi:MFS family permease